MASVIVRGVTGVLLVVKLRLHITTVLPSTGCWSGYSLLMGHLILVIPYECLGSVHVVYWSSDI